MDDPTLLLEFQDFADVFSEKSVAFLTTNISVTYAIELIEEIEIFYDLIYLLSEKKIEDIEKVF
jgi:hypothetical protein